MKIRMIVCNDTSKYNPPQLEIDGVVFNSRSSAEAFLKHFEMEMNQLWPKEKADGKQAKK